MTIDWNEMIKYSTGDLVAVEDHVLDAIRYGMSTMQTQGVATGRQIGKSTLMHQMVNSPSNRFPVLKGPCHVFTNGQVVTFEAIIPQANAYRRQHAWMHDGNLWHKCVSGPSPAPRGNRWQPVAEIDVPVELRTKLLLLS